MLCMKISYSYRKNNVHRRKKVKDVKTFASYALYLKTFKKVLFS